MERTIPENGLDGFETKHPGQPSLKVTGKLSGKILEVTRRQPSDDSTQWFLPQTGQ